MPHRLRDGLARRRFDVVTVANSLQRNRDSHLGDGRELPVPTDLLVSPYQPGRIQNGCLQFLLKFQVVELQRKSFIKNRTAREADIQLSEQNVH
jgi:hypothetical protein